MTEIVDLGVAALLEAFRTRQLSPVEAVDAFAGRIDASGGELQAFTTLCLERARVEASAAERAYGSGDEAGPLAGLPFAAKDIFDTAEVRTTYGSPMFADHVPASDADAVARLRAAGAVLVGKTSTHEFAWGITSVNPRMGTPRNPHDPSRITGGSSGGSAAALASRQVPLALATDTGGSIRAPAGFCGTSGLKPTFAALSPAGVWPLAPTLDHVGAMTLAAVDLAPALRAMGLGLADPGPAIGAARVGTCPELHLVPLADDIAPVFDAAVAALNGISAGVRQVRFADAEQIRPAFTVIQVTEAAVAHRRAGLYPSRRSEYGADVLARLQSAERLDVGDYVDATTTRLALDRRMSELFGDVDLMITPISPVAPPKIGDEEHVAHLDRRMDVRDCLLPYTVPQDLLGLPACVVRAGVDGSQLPVGVQIWGPRGSDARVLEAAVALEAVLER
ncbi:MAG: amidase [Solirubrobacterales bacterium]|nr:amidase [Solirubrobacterales bacterium]